MLRNQLEMDWDDENFLDDDFPTDNFIEDEEEETVISQEEEEEQKRRKEKAMRRRQNKSYTHEVVIFNLCWLSKNCLFSN